MSWLIWVAVHPWRYTGLPAIPVSTKPYTGSHPYCISSHPAIIPRREEVYKGFQLFLLRYQSILCILDNEIQKSGEVWWDETVTVCLLTDPPLSPVPTMKWPNSSQGWGWSTRRWWHPFSILHQIQVQKSPAWHAVHSCTKEVQRTIPSAAPPLLLLPATAMGRRQSLSSCTAAKRGSLPCFLLLCSRTSQMDLI